MPLAVTQLIYMFACPKCMPDKVKYIVQNGGVVPYIGTCDITDNLAKGLIDTCAGQVFVNDKQIWRMCDVRKVYGKEDSMYIEFTETPDVLMADGTFGDGSDPSDRDLI